MSQLPINPSNLQHNYNPLNPPNPPNLQSNQDNHLIGNISNVMPPPSLPSSHSQTGTSHYVPGGSNSSSGYNIPNSSSNINTILNPNHGINTGSNGYPSRLVTGVSGVTGLKNTSLNSTINNTTNSPLNSPLNSPMNNPMNNQISNQINNIQNNTYGSIHSGYTSNHSGLTNVNPNSSNSGSKQNIGPIQVGPSYGMHTNQSPLHGSPSGLNTPYSNQTLGQKIGQASNSSSNLPGNMSNSSFQGPSLIPNSNYQNTTHYAPTFPTQSQHQNHPSPSQMQSHPSQQQHTYPYPSSQNNPSYPAMQSTSQSSSPMTPTSAFGSPQGNSFPPFPQQILYPKDHLTPSNPPVSQVNPMNQVNYMQNVSYPQPHSNLSVMPSSYPTIPVNAPLPGHNKIQHSVINPSHSSIPMPILPTQFNNSVHAPMNTIVQNPRLISTQKMQKPELIALKKSEPQEIPESVKKAVKNATSSFTHTTLSKNTNTVNINFGSISSTQNNASNASQGHTKVLLQQDQEKSSILSLSTLPGSKPQLPTLSSLMEKNALNQNNSNANSSRPKNSLLITTLKDNFQQHSRLGKMLQHSETSNMKNMNDTQVNTQNTSIDQKFSKPNLKWRSSTEKTKSQISLDDLNYEIPKSHINTPTFPNVKIEENMEIDDEENVNISESNQNNQQEIQSNIQDSKIEPESSEMEDEEMEDEEDDGEDILRHWARIPSKHSSVIRYLYRKDPRPTPPKILKLQSKKIQFFNIQNQFNNYYVKIDSKHPYLTIKYNVGLQPTDKHAYYFEMKCLNANNNENNSIIGDPHCRVGFVTPLADDRVPIGYCENGVSYRDIDGSAVYSSKRKSYGDSYKTGDIIGCLIYMPETEEQHEESIVQVDSDDPQVKQKGETYEFILEVLKKDTVEGSFIAFFKNGQFQGIAQNNIRRCLWYPAVSLYMGAEVSINFGNSKFEYFPENLSCVNMPQIPIVSVESVSNFNYHPTFIASPLEKRIEKYKNKLEQSILPVKRKAHIQLNRPPKKQFSSSSMQDEM